MVERFAWIVIGYFILVVLMGAVVRATDSGGGCGNSWPLCNGFIYPLRHPRLATIIEFAHRTTSGVCTVLTATLAVWTFRRTHSGHRARYAVLWSAFFLVTEALLGAALVLRHWVEHNLSTGRVIAQSIHFTNTLLLMAALTLTAWFLRAEEGDLSGNEVPRWLALSAIVSTIVVGATGSLAALADTLFPSPSLQAAIASDFSGHAPLLVRMRWLHPAAAILAFISVAALLHLRSRWDRLNLAVAGMLLLQFLLGTADVLLLAPTWMQILHLLGADLYWVALVVLAGRIVWTTPAQPLSPASSTISEPSELADATGGLRLTNSRADRPSS